MTSDLIELAEAIESRANHHRALSEQSRQLRVREYHAGKADGHDADARCIRALIAVLSPRPAPALRIVTKEMADA